MLRVVCQQRNVFTALCLVFPSSWLLPFHFPHQPFKYVHFPRLPQSLAPLPVVLPLPTPTPWTISHLRVWLLMSCVPCPLQIYIPVGPACPAWCPLSPAPCPPPWGPAPCCRRWRFLQELSSPPDVPVHLTPHTNGSY